MLSVRYFEEDYISSELKILGLAFYIQSSSADIVDDYSSLSLEYLIYHSIIAPHLVHVLITPELHQIQPSERNRSLLSMRKTSLNRFEQGIEEFVNFFLFYTLHVKSVGCFLSESVKPVSAEQLKVNL